MKRVEASLDNVVCLNNDPRGKSGATAIGEGAIFIGIYNEKSKIMFQIIFKPNCQGKL